MYTQPVGVDAGEVAGVQEAVVVDGLGVASSLPR